MTALLLVLFFGQLSPTTWGGLKQTSAPVPEPKPVHVEAAE